jgi:uncharacterized protein (DUF362 family)
MKPDFCIVDGIVAMGGTKGPNDGVPIYYNTIITSKDPVAVDSVCAKILGFNPYFIGHVRKAQASSLGRIRYDLIGNLADFKKDSEYSSMYANILKFTMYLKNKGG